MNRWLLIAVAALAGCGGGGDDTYQVEYSVTSGLIFSGQRAAVTFAPSAGSVSQLEVSGSWSRTVTMRSGDALYVSAQNLQNSGTVSVLIRVDGKTLKSASSTGAFVVATASAICC